MRVLVITSSFPRDAYDIAGRFVLEHAQALMAGGIDVHVLTWAAAETGVQDVEGVKVQRVNYAPRRHRTLFYGSGAPENLSKAPLRGLLAPPALVAMLTRAAFDIGDFDAIIGHWLVPGGWIARQIGRAFGKPSLVIGHSGGVHLVAKLPRPVRSMVAATLRGPTTVSSPTLQHKARNFGIHADVLPMGFHQPAAEAGGRDWMFMGRLEPIKGLDVFLRAFNGGTIRIAGDGSERERLESLADKLGVDAEFLGIVTGPSKLKLLNQSRFAAFPSITQRGRHEGLPVSLLECASAGVLPVVGDIPGVEDYLADPTLQTLGAKPGETIAKLESLTDGELQAMSELQKERVADLEWSVLGPRWCELVAQLPTN